MELTSRLDRRQELRRAACNECCRTRTGEAAQSRAGLRGVKGMAADRPDSSLRTSVIRPDSFLGVSFRDRFGVSAVGVDL